jgi:hypothetical protein
MDALPMSGTGSVSHNIKSSKHEVHTINFMKNGSKKPGQVLLAGLKVVLAGLISLR